MILLKKIIGRTTGPYGVQQREEFLEITEDLWERRKAQFMRAKYIQATKEETERYAKEKGYVIEEKPEQQEEAND